MTPTEEEELGYDYNNGPQYCGKCDLDIEEEDLVATLLSTLKGVRSAIKMIKADLNAVAGAKLESLSLMMIKKVE